MDYRLPYYMVYPMPFASDEDERREQRDIDYLRSLYPNLAKRLLVYIIEECDRMEYEGSMIYDEYPDVLQLRLMSRRIFEKVKERENLEELEANPQGEMNMQQFGRDRDRDGRLRDLIDILLFQELLQRRKRHRRGRRMYGMSDLPAWNKMAGED